MWLAVDAAGPDVIAWPIDDAGTAGEPIVASTIGQLASRGTKIVVDGAADAPRRPCPVELTGLGGERRGLDSIVLPALTGDGVTLRGIARAVAALGKTDPKRPRLVCDVRRDGSVAWLHVAENRIARIAVTTTGAALASALADLPGAADEDDDLAFERGLGIAEDARDPTGDQEQATALARDGHVRGGAVGAMLAGVLIGHDAARGLRLGRLGSPLLLVGAGLMADRYAIALGRFGVAMRRLAPLDAFRQGCAALAGGP
jgi:hypothetical protein